MTQRSNFLIIWSVILMIYATPGRGETGLSVMAGQRTADFHRLNAGRGHDTGTGTDVILEFHSGFFEEVPLEMGFFYGTQTYSLTASQSLFDHVAAWEGGAHMTVHGPLPVGNIYARYAHTLVGALNGTVQSARVLETGGGTTEYPPDTVWEMSLTGPHIAAGWVFGLSIFKFGLWADMSFQRARVKKILIEDENRMESVGPYIKRDSDFHSSSVLISLQVGV